MVDCVFCASRSFFFFFFNDTATTEIYTLSLHDALPISFRPRLPSSERAASTNACWSTTRSEEHTSELQSHHDLVCRLLLEKKKKKTPYTLCYRLLSKTAPTSYFVASARSYNFSDNHVLT